MDQDMFDKLHQDITAIRTSQVEMQKDLQYHIRRTDLAEEAIGVLREELRPVTAHVAMWAGAGKAILLTATVLGIIAAITSLLRHT